MNPTLLLPIASHLWQSTLFALAFEVASIRPKKSGDGLRQSLYRPGGLFTATDATLNSLVLNGLKLESQKGPVDFYVIENAEKPSEN